MEPSVGASDLPRDHVETFVVAAEDWVRGDAHPTVQER